MIKYLKIQARFEDSHDHFLVIKKEPRSKFFARCFDITIVIFSVRLMAMYTPNVSMPI